MSVSEYSSCNSSVFSVSQSMESSRDVTPTDNLDNEVVKTSKRKGKSSIMQLIEESTKYDTRAEYALPTSFLRNRKKTKRIDSDDETLVTKKAHKQKQRKNNATTKAKISSEKKKKTAKDKAEIKKKNASFSKIREQTVIRELPCVKSRKENRKVPITTESKNVRRRNVKRSGLTSHIKSEDAPTPATERMDIFLSRVNEVVTINGDFFDFSSMGNISIYDNKLTAAEILTNNKNGKHAVSLRSILFHEHFEDFIVDFDSNLDYYNPMLELGQTIESAVRIYFPEAFKTDGMTLVKELNRAYEGQDENRFITIINDYNSMILKIPRQSIIEKLNATTDIPRSFIHYLLTTCYTRAIYPDANKLKKYSSFSNYVYGELMPKFLTSTFKKCGLNSESIFLDLGSGVGNCVIQAALEFGCKLSFGCEIMESASDLTEAQLAELESRCKLWGIHLKPIEYSLRKSFVDNDRVEELIPQCDVILINNFIFDAALNKKVEKIVQGLKPGAKIISLKTVRPHGYSINYDDIENIFNKLKVESFELPENSVSWTHRSVGDYFISTVQNDIDETVFCMPLLGRMRKKAPLHYTR